LPDGSELVAVEVRFPPGAAALPHRHPAFVYAYVVSGTIVSALNGEEPRTYRAGQSWHEEPGVLHRVTRNPSARKPATLLAVFITKPGESDLVQPVTGAR
jgi:quercetin dioxygenase-like cupin family protein